MHNDLTKILEELDKIIATIEAINDTLGTKEYNK